MESHFGSKGRLLGIAGSLPPGHTHQLQSFHCPSLGLDIHTFVDSFGNVLSSLEGKNGCFHMVDTETLFAQGLVCPHHRIPSLPPIIGVRTKHVSFEEASIGRMIKRWDNFEAFEASRRISFPQQLTDPMVERFCRQGESPGPGMPRPDPFGLESAAKSSFDDWRDSSTDRDMHLFIVRNVAERSYAGFLFCETSESGMREQDVSGTFSGLNIDDTGLFHELEVREMVPPGLDEGHIGGYISSIRTLYRERLNLGPLPNTARVDALCTSVMRQWKAFYAWDHRSNRAVDPSRLLLRWDEFVLHLCLYINDIAERELNPRDSMTLQVDTVCSDPQYSQSRIGSVLFWMAEQELVRLHQLYSESNSIYKTEMNLESVPDAVAFYEHIGFHRVDHDPRSSASSSSSTRPTALTDMITRDLTAQPLSLRLPF